MVISQNLTLQELHKSHYVIIVPAVDIRLNWSPDSQNLRRRWEQSWNFAENLDNERIFSGRRDEIKPSENMNFFILEIIYWHKFIKNVRLLVTWSDKRRSENRGHKDGGENKRNAIQLTKNYIQQLDYNANVSAEYPKIGRGTMEYIWYINNLDFRLI